MVTVSETQWLPAGPGGQMVPVVTSKQVLCGNRYQDGVGNQTLGICYCSTGAIGTCGDCGQPVCGDHSVRGNPRRCIACAGEFEATERGRVAAAQADLHRRSAEVAAAQAEERHQAYQALPVAGVAELVRYFARTAEDGDGFRLDALDGASVAEAVVRSDLAEIVPGNPDLVRPVDATSIIDTQRVVSKQEIEAVRGLLARYKPRSIQVETVRASTAERLRKESKKNLDAALVCFFGWFALYIGSLFSAYYLYRSLQIRRVAKKVGIPQPQDNRRAIVAHAVPFIIFPTVATIIALTVG